MLSSNLVNQETQTTISGPQTTESPNNSYSLVHSNANNANSEFMTGLSNFCTGAAGNQSTTEDSILSNEFKQKLWTLFRQIEVEFEKESKRIVNENYHIQERNEKMELSDHEEMNIAKKISSSHISQKIKQQYKQSKQSTSRFVSNFRDKTNSGQIGGVSGGSANTSGINQMGRHSCSMLWRATDHRDGIWEVNSLGRGLVGTACADGVVRLWNSETGHCSLIYLGHSGSVNSVRFKNGYMLTASGDGTAHLVSLPADKINEAHALHSDQAQKASVTDYGNSAGDDEMNTAEGGINIGTGLNEPSADIPSNVPLVLRNPNSMYQTASFYNSTGAFPTNPMAMNTTTASSSTAAGQTGTTSNQQITGASVTNPLFGAGAIAVGGAAGIGNSATSGQATFLTYCDINNLQDCAPLAAADFLVQRDQIVTAGWDRLGRIYDVATGAEVSSLTGHDLPLTDVRTSPNCDHSLAVTTSRDCTFRLWDFRCSSTEVHVQQGHNGHVSSVNFLGNSSDKLVSAGADRYCKLWDLRQNRNPLKEFRTDAPINRLAIHPNGKVVALPLDNRNVKLIDLNLGNRLVRFPARSSSQSHSRIVTSVCWTSDGQGSPNFFSVGFDHQLLAWNIQLTASLL